MIKHIRKYDGISQVFPKTLIKNTLVILINDCKDTYV